MPAAHPDCEDARLWENIMDKLAKINRDYIERQKFLDTIIKLLSVFFTLAGILLFAVCVFRGVRETQAQICAVAIISFTAGEIISNGFLGIIKPVPAIILFLVSVMLFAFSFLANVEIFLNSSFSLEGSAVFCILIPVIVFVISKFWKYPQTVFYNIDSITTSLHEAGHASLVPVFRDFCVRHWLDSYPEKGMGGRFSCVIYGTNREKYAAQMLTTLGGICAESVFGVESENGFERDILQWKMYASLWLRENGRKISPVLLHSMLHKQEQMIMRHIETNREIIEQLAERYRELGGMDHDEIKKFLDQIVVLDELEEWFQEYSEQ